MKEISVKTTKSYTHGFLLTEQELRRLVDSIQGQFDKIAGDHIVTTSYKMTLANGANVVARDLDSVFFSDNAGSEKITELEIYMSDGKQEDDINYQLFSEEAHNTVYVRFSHLSESDRFQFKDSIIFRVTGLSRDWVFVTCSMLDERIVKIKRGSQRSNDPYRTDWTRIAFLGIMITTLISMIISIIINGKVYTQNQERFVDSLFCSWQKGVLTDPIEALLLTQKSRIVNSDISWLVFKPLIITVLTPILILIVYMIISAVTKRHYMRYVFCWGDLEAAFNKAENKRKTLKTIIWVVIGLGTLTSVVGSIIVHYLL